MELTLDPELEEKLQRKIESGEYPSVNAAMNEALRRLLEPFQDPDDPYPLDKMRELVMVGVEQSERGEVVDFDAEAIKAEGRRIFAMRGRK